MIPKGTVGSNPTLSATNLIRYGRQLCYEVKFSQRKARDCRAEASVPEYVSERDQEQQSSEGEI